MSSELQAPALSPRWIDGNRFELLENGEHYFPAVFNALARAKHEVFIETFILFEDQVGRELQTTLVAAGRRGVSIDVLVDGYGSPDFSNEFLAALTAAGVRLHIYDPRPKIFGLRTNIFRRMHRKIVSIDGATAFVGGINFAADHLDEFGPMAKQDYAVLIEGPLAVEIHAFARSQAALFGKHQWRWWPMYRRQVAAGETAGKALLVTRDNDRHRDEIERHYRIAIRAAKREIIIASAYFFPGYRLLRQLRQAARRGVRVKLILQGEPDMPYAKAAGSLLYPHLVEVGIEIHEYCRRPLHAKVAVIDDDWCTIGSSNLDPLSLALNLEANVVIREPRFTSEVRSRLNDLMRQHCKLIDFASVPRRSAWRVLIHTLAFHSTRHFPVWAGWLPAHTPKLKSIEPEHRDAQLNDRLLDVRESR